MFIENIDFERLTLAFGPALFFLYYSLLHRKYLRISFREFIPLTMAGIAVVFLSAVVLIFYSGNKEVSYILKYIFFHDIGELGEFNKGPILAHLILIELNAVAEGLVIIGILTFVIQALVPKPKSNTLLYTDSCAKYLTVVALDDYGVNFLKFFRRVLVGWDEIISINSISNKVPSGIIKTQNKSYTFPLTMVEYDPSVSILKFKTGKSSSVYSEMGKLDGISPVDCPLYVEIEHRIDKKT